MKKLLSLVVLIFVVIGVYGQETAPSSSLDRKWVIKFQPVNLPLFQYSFEGERMLNAKNSVTLGIGIPHNASLAGKYGIKTSDVSKADINTMHIRAAYRHYTGNSGLPKGFYLEPYLKYQKLKADGTANSINNDDTDVKYSADIKADMHSMNAGVQLGAQFLIAKRVAIDLYFLGLEAGMLNVEFTGTPSGGSSNVADLKAKVDDAIKDIPLIKDKLNTDSSTSTDVIVKSNNVFYPFIRGGISIGIAF